MHIYIIRHGETNANTEGRLQGWMDIPLNHEGERLAVITGEALRGTKFDAAFSSPLRRALRTAELVLSHSGNGDIPVQPDDRIKEICCGTMEGCCLRDHHASVDGFFRNPLSFGRFPQGESVSEVCARTQAFLRELATKPYENVLIATHACALRAMLNFLYENPADFWHGHPPYNCAVSIVEAKDGKLTLVADDRIYYDPGDCVDRFR